MTKLLIDNVQIINNFKLITYFPVWLRNRFLFAGLEPVLSQTEISCIASNYRHFSKYIKMKIRIKTGFNLIFFDFDIRRKKLYNTMRQIYILCKLYWCFLRVKYISVRTCLLHLQPPPPGSEDKCRVSPRVESWILIATGNILS